MAHTARGGVCAASIVTKELVCCSLFCWPARPAHLACPGCLFWLPWLPRLARLGWLARRICNASSQQHCILHTESPNSTLCCAQRAWGEAEFAISRCTAKFARESPLFYLSCLVIKRQTTKKNINPFHKQVQDTDSILLDFTLKASLSQPTMIDIPCRTIKNTITTTATVALMMIMMMLTMTTFKLG